MTYAIAHDSIRLEDGWILYNNVGSRFDELGMYLLEHQCEDFTMTTYFPRIRNEKIFCAHCGVAFKELALYRILALRKYPCTVEDWTDFWREKNAKRKTADG